MSNSNNVPIGFSIFPHVGKAIHFPHHVADFDELVGLLEVCSRRKLNSKEESLLICPSIFRDEFSRRRDDVVASGFLMLDNDGNGSLRPKQFASILPRIRMVLVNTFSSTKKKPKWRVYIQIRRCLNTNEYMSLTHALVDHVRSEGGLSFGQDGFDTTKFGPEALFYLPSKSGRAGGSFFHDFCDPPRKPLDPDIWLDRIERQIIQKDCAASRSIRKFEKNPTLVETAKDKWRSTPRGNGSQSFFRLGVDLAYAGMRASEIASTLTNEAAYGISPNERRAQVAGVMASLQRYRLISST